MRIEAITLHLVRMKLISPFGTSYGTYEDRESIIIEMKDEEGHCGWGEVVAFSQPWYTEETVHTSWHILETFLIPILLEQELSHPHDVPALFQYVKRNHMAKAGLEGAIWDLYAQRTNQSLAAALGGVHASIPVGVVVGLADTKTMLQQIERYAMEGYERFKVKIKKGRDVELLRDIRRAFPSISLMADANSAYNLQDKEHLQRLDEFQLLMIEQPFADTDFLDHALLQREIATPICLDESIHTLEDARVAIKLGSCKIINIKPGRVGGLTEAVRMHDYCTQHNIPVWCGGMIETGISRAQNIALASLPNFTIPGDISASSRHWERDVIIPPVTLQNGRVMVSTAIGLGYGVDRGYLQQVTMKKQKYER